MVRILARIGVNAVALWVTSEILTGVDLQEGFWKIVLVAVIFGVVNAVLRPIAKLLSFPAIFLTLGLFILVINAVMLIVTDWLTASLTVDGFGDALLGALIISVVSWLLSVFVPDKKED
jgi:putative membrane protein